LGKGIMVKIVNDRQEVLALINAIESPHVPVESKLKAIGRLEHILGREISGTKEFKKIRDEYAKGEENGSK
jgi:hypothetical protein